MLLKHLHCSVITLQHLECTSWFKTPSFPWRKLPVNTEGSWGLPACGDVGGYCKVASLTPQVTWGPCGRRGCRGKMKSTLVSATSRLEWPYVRFSDTGQLPLTPAVWGTQNMVLISQEGLSGCTNRQNCKDDSNKTKCAGLNLKVSTFWWMGATEVKLEGTWINTDEYGATASPPLLAKEHTKKIICKTRKNSPCKWSDVSLASHSCGQVTHIYINGMLCIPCCGRNHSSTGLIYVLFFMRSILWKLDLLFFAKLIGCSMKFS